MLKVPVFLALHPLGAPVYCHWRIQGGALETHNPSRSKFFHFRAVVGKNLAK